MSLQHENLLYNLIMNPKKAVKDRIKLGKTWYKRMFKYFPKSFGVEIEIDESCIRRPTGEYRTDYLNRKIAKKIRNGFMAKYHEKYHYFPVNFGTDSDCVEMRTYTSLESVETLETGLSVFRENIVDFEFENSLHIHIPFINTVTKDSENRIKSIEGLLKYKESLLRKSIKSTIARIDNDRRKEVYSEILNNKKLFEQISLSSDILEGGDCKAMRALRKLYVRLGIPKSKYELINDRDEGKCKNCLGCGWNDDIRRVESKCEKEGLILNKSIHSEKRKDFLRKIDVPNIKEKFDFSYSNISEKICRMLQSHHGERISLHAYYDDRGKFVNLQPDFNTAEFRRMRISNNLPYSEVMQRVFLTRGLYSFAMGTIDEKELESRLNFIKAIS